MYLFEIATTSPVTLSQINFFPHSLLYYYVTYLYKKVYCSCIFVSDQLSRKRFSLISGYLKGLSHEIDFKTFDKNLQKLA